LSIGDVSSKKLKILSDLKSIDPLLYKSQHNQEWKNKGIEVKTVRIYSPKHLKNIPSKGDFRQWIYIVFKK